MFYSMGYPDRVSFVLIVEEVDFFIKLHIAFLGCFGVWFFGIVVFCVCVCVWVVVLVVWKNPY